MIFRLIACLGLSCALLMIMVASCRENQQQHQGDSQVAKPAGQPPEDPEQCRSCHGEIVRNFLETGKGRSFFKAQDQYVMEDWTVDPVYDAKLDLYYLPYRTRAKAGDSTSSFFIKEFRLEMGDTIHQKTHAIDFFIGSGNKARSYLFQRNGYLYEMPLTWYSAKKIWDLSPGYENGGNHRFDREVGEECMACHNSGFEAIEYSINRYRNFGHALSCQSCHGPSDAHLKVVGSKPRSGSLPGILKLSQASVQARMDVCRNCHLEGIKVRRENAKAGSFEPGKRFSDYFALFIPSTGNQAFGFASHSERLQLSACFSGSNGQMTCVTCHNPHEVLPVETSDFFNQKCNACHSKDAHQKVCSVSGSSRKGTSTKKAGSDCISCHLQKSGTSDIPHVHSTDHWIRKNPEKTKQSRGELVFRNFAGDAYTPKDKGTAILQYAENHADTSVLRQVKQYLKHLDPEQQLKYAYLNGNLSGTLPDSVRYSNSQNPWTLFYWSQLKRNAGQSYQDLLAKACERAPDMIEFQYRRAVAEAETGSPEKAYERVLVLHPLHVKSLSNLGFYYLQKQEYSRAEEVLSKALSQDPDFILAQENLARCYLEQGKFSNCKTILNRLIKKYPAEDRYKRALESIP